MHMRFFLILTLLMSSLLSVDKKQEKQNITEEHLKIQMEKEKKYAREQKFYSSKNYDFKGAQVNPKSLKNITLPEVQDDFDMDNVYD